MVQSYHCILITRCGDTKQAEAWLLMTPSSHPQSYSLWKLSFWCIALSWFCQGHLADDTGSFETSLEIFHPQQEVERRKNLPIDGVCLLAFGCLSKLIFRGGKMHGYGFAVVVARLMKRVLIGKAGGVLCHRAFMTVPTYSVQGQTASYCLRWDKPSAAERLAAFVFSCIIKAFFQ